MAKETQEKHTLSNGIFKVLNTAVLVKSYSIQC